MVNNLADLAVTTFLAEQIKNVRIAVIGDVMLDRYFQGEVKRISPEAPVPVTRITKINSVLGGAANVAANLAHLECQVFMGGVTGDDENRLLLEKLMDDAGINHQRGATQIGFVAAKVVVEVGFGGVVDKAAKAGPVAVGGFVGQGGQVGEVRVLRGQVEKFLVVIQLGLVARAVHQGDRLGDAARQQFVDHRARAG